MTVLPMSLQGISGRPKQFLKNVLWHRQCYMLVKLFIFLLSTQEDHISQSSLQLSWDHMIAF